MSNAQQLKPKPHARLDRINDDLGVVRRRLNRTEQPLGPEDADLLRIAIDRIHSRYEELAFEMRQADDMPVPGGGSS